jgi:hypothetical protein
MRKKQFQLIKELMLHQMAGAGDSVEKSIDLAIDVYCEMTNTDANEFKKEWQHRKLIIWSLNGKWLMDNELWKRYMVLYEIAIDEMEVE